MLHQIRLLASHRYSPVFGIILLALCSVIPGLIYGPTGIDIFTVGVWMEEFARQFLEGEFYPRWLENIFVGHGSPVFFYYPPLPFYLGTLFYFLRDTEMYGYHMLLGVAAIGQVASGLFFYFWLRDGRRLSVNASCLGAALYIFVPPHLSQSFHSLMLIGQTIAFVWFPLIFWMIDRLLQEKPFTWVALSLAFAGLLLTNIPNFIMFYPLAFLYAAMLSFEHKRVEILATVLLTTAVAIGLCGIFVLPAWLYQSYTLIDMQWTTYGPQSYVHRLLKIDKTFLSSLTHNTVYFIAIATSLSLAIALSLLIYKSDKKKKNHLWLCFWLFAALMSMLMNTILGKPFWEYVPLIKMVQIPSRYFAIIAIVVCILAAKLWHETEYSGPMWRYNHIFVFMVLLSFIGILLLSANTKRIGHDELLETPGNAKYSKYFSLYYSRALDKIDQNFAFLSGEELIGRFYQEKPHKDWNERRTKIRVLQGKTKAEVKTWKPRLLEISLDIKDDTIISVRQFYFPGWIGFLDDKPLAVSREFGTGRMLISLPKDLSGKHELRLELMPLYGEIIGRLLSILTLIGLLITVAIQFSRINDRKPLSLS
jgi:hypothetical protein